MVLRRWLDEPIIGWSLSLCLSLERDLSRDTRWCSRISASFFIPSVLPARESRSGCQTDHERRTASTALGAHYQSRHRQPSICLATHPHPRTQDQNVAGCRFRRAAPPPRHAAQFRLHLTTRRLELGVVPASESPA